MGLTRYDFLSKKLNNKKILKEDEFIMEEKRILSNEEINKVTGGDDAMLEGQDKRRKECSGCKKSNMTSICM